MSNMTIRTNESIRTAKYNDAYFLSKEIELTGRLAYYSLQSIFLYFDILLFDIQCFDIFHLRNHLNSYNKDQMKTLLERG